MKSAIRYLYESGDKFWNGIQIAALVAIFGYFFAENFALSESWEVLSLRSIDDYAIQDSIHSMQKALLSGNWPRVFGFFDYAYGNAFWLINSILLLPLYFIGDAQVLIVAGRQISLLFVFASIYLVGLIIDRLRPDGSSLKYAVLIAISTMPMVSIIATKFHVNAQPIFFGILSFYLLVRDPGINRRSMLLSAVFAAMAVGFKFTGILIVPLLWITLLNRLHQRGIQNIIREQVVYFAVFIVITAACTAPALLLFPFYLNELGSTYKTFLLFKNMASSEVPVSMGILVDAFRFYLSPLSLLAFSALFLALVLDDIKQKQYISLYILGTIVSAVLLVIAIAHKGPIYIATYFLSLAFFMPLGLLGIRALKVVPNKLGPLLAYCIVVAGLFYGVEHRRGILVPYDFLVMIKNEKTQKQLLALDGIRRIVYPLKLPVRILQDSSSIFPATRFADGVDVAINYGDLKEKSTWGDFDYILLNSDTYYGKRLASQAPNKDQSTSMPSADNLEEATRKTLHDTGYFYGKKYRLIYSQYDALLYKLETK